MQQVEDPQHRRLVGDEVDRAAEQALPVEDPQQAAGTGGVDEGDASQVDHEAVHTTVEQREEAVAQGGTAGHIDLSRDLDHQVRAGRDAGREG